MLLVVTVLITVHVGVIFLCSNMEYISYPLLSSVYARNITYLSHVLKSLESNKEITILFLLNISFIHQCNFREEQLKHSSAALTFQSHFCTTIYLLPQ